MMPRDAEEGWDRQVPAELARALRAMLPADIGLALRPVTAPAAPLPPEEARAVARAVPARRRDFAAGRMAARAALVDAGLAPAPLPMGPDHAPVWPPGACGSISHARGLAGALAARTGPWASVGLDLEGAAPMPPDMAALILTEGDRPPPELDPGLGAMLVFSAKEAAFKAQFPLTGCWTDYREASVAIGPGRFSLIHHGVPVTGRWTIAAGMIATVLTIPAPSPFARADGAAAARGTGRGTSRA